MKHVDPPTMIFVELGPVAVPLLAGARPVVTDAQADPIEALRAEWPQMTPAFSSYGKLDPLVGYYLATPLFALADLGFGLSVRVAGLEEPWQRGLYYAAAFACGALCRLHPPATPWVGIAESSTNLLLLFLSILLPIWGLPDAVMSGGEVALPYDAQSMVNTLIGGTVLVVAFHRSRARIEGPPD